MPYTDEHARKWALLPAYVDLIEGGDEMEGHVKLGRRAYSTKDRTIEGEIIEVGGRNAGDPGWIKIRLDGGSEKTLREGEFELVPEDEEA
jgi:hypothetical protein